MQVLLCNIAGEEKIPFHKEHSGYFNIYATYHDDNPKGYHELLHCDHCQGHIVGTIVNIASRKDKHRPLNEADYQVYIDGELSPSVIGTGLEDWYGYGHTWRFGNAPNSSFSFIGAPHVTTVGQPHAATIQKPEIMESVHSYRLNILDPITFHSSLRFIIEGNESQNYTALLPITYTEYLRRLKKRKYTQAHAILYYASERKYAKMTDKIMIGNHKSEILHNYLFYSTPEINCLNNTFIIKDKYFIGNQYDSSSHNKVGRALCPNTTVTFQLRTKKAHRFMALRRTSYQKPFEWNTKAKLSINNKYIGLWESLKGSNNDKFSLKDSDFLLNNKVDFKSPGILNISITSITYWRDISYTIIAV